LILMDPDRDAAEEPVEQGMADDAVSAEQREEVQAWLDAVALCFDLPEGRRWIDPDRLEP